MLIWFINWSYYLGPFILKRVLAIMMGQTSGPVKSQSWSGPEIGLVGPPANTKESSY